MNKLDKVLLYYINMMTDVAGCDVVGRIDIAGLCGCTVQTAQKNVKNLVELGYVHVTKKLIARGAGYKYIYHITDAGMDACHNQWQEAYNLFYDYINQRMIETIEKYTKISKPRGKPKKVSQKQLKLEI